MLDNEGQTALHLAAKEKGNQAVVKLLLDYGDSIPPSHLSNAVWLDRPDNNGWTAIYWAATQCGNEEIISLLVDHDAYIKKLDNGCVEAVLEWAYKNNHESTIKYMERHLKKD